MTYDGEPVDIGDVVDGIIDPLVGEIVAQTSQRWPDLVGVDKILVAGGGGALMGSRIQDRIPRAIVVDESMWANARGYFKLLGVK